MVTMIGTRPVKAPGWTGKPRTDLALIDCDVHQTIKKPEDLFPYLSAVYKQQIVEQGLRFPGSGYFNVAKDAARTDLAHGLVDGRVVADHAEGFADFACGPSDHRGFGAHRKIPQA